MESTHFIKTLFHSSLHSVKVSLRRLKIHPTWLYSFSSIFSRYAIIKSKVFIPKVIASISFSAT